MKEKQERKITKRRKKATIDGNKKRGKNKKKNKRKKTKSYKKYDKETT